MTNRQKILRNPKTGQFVVGRAAFAKISAVEGLKMTEGMAADFERLDRDGASAEERRKFLVSKYGG